MQDTSSLTAWWLHQTSCINYSWFLFYSGLKSTVVTYLLFNIQIQQKVRYWQKDVLHLVWKAAAAAAAHVTKLCELILCLHWLKVHFYDTLKAANA